MGGAGPKGGGETLSKYREGEGKDRQGEREKEK